MLTMEGESSNGHSLFVRLDKSILQITATNSRLPIDNCRIRYIMDIER